MPSKPHKPLAHPRSAYRVWRTISTRWMDNDAYGHVNNVVYYSWFDTAVNAYLIERGALDVANGASIGLVVETHCNYFAPLSFPQTVDVGLRVAHRGTSSVRYEIGIFGADDSAAARWRPLFEPWGVWQFEQSSLTGWCSNRNGPRFSAWHW